MEKNTKEQIKAEIIDGKLIIDGKHEFNLEGIKKLVPFGPTNQLAERIDDIICSIAQIFAHLVQANSGDELEDLSGLLPHSDSIFYLKVISDSLKKM